MEGSGGIYDTLFECENCDEQFLLSVDGRDKLPTDMNCTGSKLSTLTECKELEE